MELRKLETTVSCQLEIERNGQITTGKKGLYTVLKELMERTRQGETNECGANYHRGKQN